jgi:NADH-quinone oxidoreductase subunit M
MGAIFAFVAIASLGLPGLAGFWGEIMALLAAFSPAPALTPYLGLYRVLMVFGAIGTVLTAGYFLWMMQRVMMGQAPDKWKEASLHDVSTLELGTWLPLLIMTGLLGVLPVLVTGITDADVTRIMQVFS